MVEACTGERGQAYSKIGMAQEATALLDCEMVQHQPQKVWQTL